MKKRKPTHITIKTPFWTASVSKLSLWIALSTFIVIVAFLFFVFHIFWIAFLSTLVGFGVFALLMPRPGTPPPDNSGLAVAPTPKKPSPGEQKRQKSGRK